MIRSSIVGLMGFVFITAIGLAALRNADATWSGIMLLVALGLLGVATLGGIQLRGRERAWWLGFALFEGGYLAVVFGPWFADHVQPKLATTQLLNAYVAFSSRDIGTLYAMRAEALNELNMRKMSKDFDDPSLVPFQEAVDRLDARISEIQGSPPKTFGDWGAGPPAPKNRWWQANLQGAKNHDPFLQIGHCLFALLAGLIGASVSKHFRSRRGPAEGIGD